MLNTHSKCLPFLRETPAIPFFSGVEGDQPLPRSRSPAQPTRQSLHQDVLAALPGGLQVLPAPLQERPCERGGRGGDQGLKGFEGQGRTGLTIGGRR